jgi:hypothetical protein
MHSVPYTNIASLGIASASFVIQVFDELKQYLDRKAGKKIVTYPEQEKILHVLSILNNHPELKEDVAAIEFFEGYRIILRNNKIGFTKKETAEDYINETIEKMRTDESVNKIDLLPLEEYQEYGDILLTKYASKEIAEVSSRLGKTYKRLLALSIRLETLYKERRLDDVENLKEDIVKIDKDFGLKFCNLYMRGYLKKFMSSTLYIAEDREDVDKCIKKFIQEDCKSIYFISNIYQMKIEYVAKIIKKVNVALNNRDGYIAIHSLGKARKLAKKAIAEINLPENTDYYEPITVEVGTELSKIWYRGSKGLEILNLIKDTILLS